MDWTAIYPFWSAGIVSAWADATRRAVSRILLSDRFPRNMFRGDERSFESDHLAPLAGVMVKNDRTG